MSEIQVGKRYRITSLHPRDMMYSCAAWLIGQEGVAGDVVDGEYVYLRLDYWQSLIRRHPTVRANTSDPKRGTCFVLPMGLEPIPDCLPAELAAWDAYDQEA